MSGRLSPCHPRRRRGWPTDQEPRFRLLWYAPQSETSKPERAFGRTSWHCTDYLLGEGLKDPLVARGFKAHLCFFL